jgi:hypothetical protein
MSGYSNARAGTPIVNTHVHRPPNVSAVEPAEQAAHLAAAQGVAVLGTSNYSDFGVYGQFAAAAAGAGVVPLFGVEIITLIDAGLDGGMLYNDPTNLNRMYLCGKALSHLAPMTPSAAKTMTAMRRASEDRIRLMTSVVASLFAGEGLDGAVTADRIAASVAARAGVSVAWVSLQERHVAQSFQELLFAEVAPRERVSVLGRLFGSPPNVDPADPVAVQEAIRSNLMKAGKPAFVPEAAVSFDDAYRLILELGGIPCYPILADGASPICAFEDSAEALAERLLSRDIYCAELIPVRNLPEVVDRYVSTLRGAGIVVTAGTEHNTQRMIPLAPSALGGRPLSEMAREEFWEATCIVAAHQELAGSGKPGYVDRDGRLNGDFADGEARIRAFREMGADLIASRSAVRIQG